jgi:hypothetical protein
VLIGIKTKSFKAEKYSLSASSILSPIPYTQGVKSLTT